MLFLAGKTEEMSALTLCSLLRSFRCRGALAVSDGFVVFILSTDHLY